MVKLKNVNLLSFDKWESAEKSDDELYNVNAASLPKEFFTQFNSKKIPDYTAGVTLTNDVEYVAQTNGVIRIRYQVGDSSATRYIDINGFRFTSYHTNYNEDIFYIPIKKGDVYTFVGTFKECHFYPVI